MSAKHLNAILVLCLLFSLTCLGFPFGFVTAEPWPRVPGVKVGDMAEYGNFLVRWVSESSGAVPPQNFIDVNNTLSLFNTVVEVTNSTMSFESCTLYRNSTWRNETISVDVATGFGSGNLTFVAAELGVGDSIYIAEDFSDFLVQSASLRSYCGLMRESILLNETQEFSDSGMAFWTKLYWDRATGVLLEHFWSYTELSETGLLTAASISYNMVDNNMWVDVSDSVAPAARAGSDRTVDVGETVVFDASESWDNVGIAGILWDFGDGESASGLGVSHAYGGSGVFNVTLTVEDGAGNKGLDYAVVTVREQGNYVLTPGIVFLTACLIVIVCLLSIRWFLQRKRRLRVQGRRRRA